MPGGDADVRRVRAHMSAAARYRAKAHSHEARARSLATSFGFWDWFSSGSPGPAGPESPEQAPPEQAPPKAGGVAMTIEEIKRLHGAELKAAAEAVHKRIEEEKAAGLEERRKRSFLVERPGERGAFVAAGLESHGEIPRMVEECVASIRKALRGNDGVEGIFRKSVDKAHMETIIARHARGDDTRDVGNAQMAAALLAWYLQSIGVPLLSNVLDGGATNVNVRSGLVGTSIVTLTENNETRLQDRKSVRDALMVFLQYLPDPRKRVLSLIVGLLREVVANKAATKMDAEALAEAEIGQSLVRANRTGAERRKSVDETTAVVRVLIEDDETMTHLKGESAFGRRA